MAENSNETLMMIMRFYDALDAIIAKKELRGVQTFCRLYNIDRRNFLLQKHNPKTRYLFKLDWIYYIVKDFKVSPEWIILGYGKMFKS